MVILAPYKLKLATLSLNHVKQAGFYSISYLIQHQNKIMTNQTQYVCSYANPASSTSSVPTATIPLSVSWNEDIEFQLIKTNTMLEWSLLYKKDEDSGATMIETGSIVLNSLQMQEPIIKSLLIGSSSSASSTLNSAPNSVGSSVGMSLDIRIVLTRNDSAIKVLTKEQNQQRLHRQQHHHQHHHQHHQQHHAESSPLDNIFFTSKKHYGAIYIIFQEIMNQSYFDYLSSEWCKDCIQDTNNLVEAFVVKDGELVGLNSNGPLLMETSKRSSLKLFNGSKIFCSNTKFRQHHPAVRSYPLEEDHSVLIMNRASEGEEKEVHYVRISFINRYLLWNFIKWLQYSYHYWKTLEHHKSPFSPSSSSKHITAEGHSPTHFNRDYQSWIDMITPPVWVMEENMIYETDCKIFFYEKNQHYSGKMKIDLSQFYSIQLLNKGNHQLQLGLSLQSMHSLILSSDAVYGEESMIQFEINHCELLKGKRLSVPKVESSSLEPLSITDPKTIPRGKNFFSNLFSSSLKTVQNTTAGMISSTVSATSDLLLYSTGQAVSSKDLLIIKCEGRNAAFEYDPKLQQWCGKTFIENRFSKAFSRKSGHDFKGKRQQNRNTQENSRTLPENKSIIAYDQNIVQSGIILLLRKGNNNSTVSSNLFNSHDSSIKISEGTAKFLENGIIGQRYLPLNRVYPLIAIDSDVKTPRVASDFLQENVNYRENEVLIELNSQLGFSVTVLQSQHPSLSNLSVSNGIMNYDPKLTGLLAKCKFVDENGISITSSVSSTTIPLSSAEEVSTGSFRFHLNWKNTNFILSAENGLEKAEYVRIEFCIVFLANKYLSKESLGGIFIPIGFFHGKSVVYNLPIIPFREQPLPPKTASSTKNFSESADVMSFGGYIYGNACYGQVSVEIKRIEELKEFDQTIPAVLLKISSQMSPISATWWMTETILKGNIPVMQHLRDNHHNSRNTDLNSDYITVCYVHLGYNDLLIDLSDAILATNISTKVIPTYRSEISRQFNNHILLNCEEVDPEKMMLVLPYDQVLSASFVTASILSMEIAVGRYFGSTNNEKVVFRRTSVVCYISNCPANHLSQYIEDRKFFSLIRKQLFLLLQEINLKKDSLTNKIEETEHAEELKQQQDNLLTSTINLFIEMNDVSSMLETRLQRVFSPLDKHPNEKVYELNDHDSESEDDNDADGEKGRKGEYDDEGNDATLHAEERFEDDFETELIDEMVTQLGGRICRLRLYTSILFGMNLPCSHRFEIKSIHQVIDQDFFYMRANILTVQASKEQSEKLTLVPSDSPFSSTTATASDEITAMNHSIDYLIEMLEHRIIETMICGWNLDSHLLLSTLEIFINRYYIEIVSLLGKYFEDSIQITIQGITNKMDIIHSYLKYHDVIANIITRLFLPYGIVTYPLPTLSLFLDFHVLVSWYVSSLVGEMRIRVDNVVAVWKDRQKDVTGEGSYYSTAIPWIPQRISAVSSSEEVERDRPPSSEGTDATSIEVSMVSSILPVGGGSKTEDFSFKRKMITLTPAEYFLTNIPEDVLMILNSYLQYSRIHLKDHENSEIAVTAPNMNSLATEINQKLLSESLEELNHKIYISYFHALLYLATEYYEKELLQLPSFSMMRDENEQTEHIIWICSVINDTYRMMHYPYFDTIVQQVSDSFPQDDGEGNAASSRSSSQNTKEEEEIPSSKQRLKQKYHGIIESVIQAYKKIYLIAMQQISCYIFHIIFLEENLLYQDNFFTAWYHGIQQTDSLAEKDLLDRNSESDSRSFFTSSKGLSASSSSSSMDLMKLLIQDLLNFLIEIMHYLIVVDCQLLLIELCMDKIIIIFYYLLRNTRNHHFSFQENHDLFIHLKGDFEYMKEILVQFAKQVLLRGKLSPPSSKDNTQQGGSSTSTTVIGSGKIEISERMIEMRLSKRWRLLEYCIQLIDEEVMSNNFILVIKELSDECMTNLKHSFAIFKLMIICLALKGIKECFPKKYHLMNLMTPANNNNNNNNSNPTSGGTASVKATEAIPAKTASSKSQGSEKQKTIFPIFHRVETVVKKISHRRSSSQSGTTTTDPQPVQKIERDSAPTSRSQSKDIPFDDSLLEPRLSADEMNTMYQETFSKEVEGLRNQVGYDWILSILNDIQQHHYQFNLIIDKHSHLTVSEVLTRLLQSTETNNGQPLPTGQYPETTKAEHHSILKDYEPLHQLSIEDFSPECLVFGILKKHKYSLRQLLLSSVAIYLQYTNYSPPPLSVAEGDHRNHNTSPLSSEKIEERNNYKFFSTHRNPHHQHHQHQHQLDEESSGSLNPFHSFQLWRKKIRKNLLKTFHPPPQNKNNSNNSNNMIDPFHPNHFHASLFVQKGFHSKGGGNGGGKGHLLTMKKLQISNLQIVGVIPFLRLISTKLYLQFKLNDLTITTKAKEQYYNDTGPSSSLPPVATPSLSNGGCIFDETIELPITIPNHLLRMMNYERGGGSGSNNSNMITEQKMTLTISLFNSGYLIHELLAKTTIEFYLISPPNFRNKMIEFQEWMKTFRFQSTNNLKGSSGSVNPKLKLSIETIE